MGAAERHSLRRALGVRGVTFAYVGRLYLQKGLSFLVDAFAALQTRESQEVSLMIVGDGPDEAVLRSRCETKKLRNVTFCGFQDAETLPRFYAASDAFVFPTLGEPFGLVVLEAMASGLPVIATTTSGEITSRVIDGVTGFLVPPADSGALLERMTLLARDSDLRQRMSAASVAKVSGQTPDLWAEAFEQAIEKILSMPRVRDPRLRGSRDAMGEDIR
jgi:colanic acid/amylovoran biosynthesis glycosyltransferase